MQRIASHGKNDCELLYITICTRLVGMKIVPLSEVMLSEAMRQEDKSVSMDVIIVVFVPGW